MDINGKEVEEEEPMDYDSSDYEMLIEKYEKKFARYDVEKLIKVPFYYDLQH